MLSVLEGGNDVNLYSAILCLYIYFFLLLNLEQKRLVLFLSHYILGIKDHSHFTDILAGGVKTDFLQSVKLVMFAFLVINCGWLDRITFK